MRLAAESARFSVAFVKIGLMPDAGVTYFLPRIVGLGRAIEMSMLGDAVDAEEAYRIGLVNRVVPDEMLMEETASFAKRLAAMPTRALGSMKQALYASFESDLETALEREAVGQALCGYTGTTRRASRPSSRSANLTSPDAKNGKTFSGRIVQRCVTLSRGTC